MNHKRLFLSVSTFILGLFLSCFSAFAQTYYVQAGDSLYSIAARYGTTISSLKNTNNLSETTIYPGQALSIVSTASTSTTVSYTVKSGDSLYLISQKYGITLDALKAANTAVGNVIFPGQKLTVPTATTVSNTGSGYNYYGYILSSSDIDLLARLVSAESRGESLTGQVAVANTVLRRLLDSRYPNTLYGVIYQIDQGRYQYSPVMNGEIDQAAAQSAITAVQQALNGWDPSNGANGFYNPEKTTNAWVRSHTVTAIIGNHVFYSY